MSGAASGFINVWTQKGVLITSLNVPKHRVNCCDLSVVMKSNNDDATIDLDPGTHLSFRLGLRNVIRKVFLALMNFNIFVNS